MGIWYRINSVQDEVFRPTILFGRYKGGNQMYHCNKKKPRRMYSTIVFYRECIFYLTMFLICAVILCCHFSWKMRAMKKEVESMNQTTDELITTTNTTVQTLRKMELRILIARDEIEDLQSSIKANMEIIKGISIIASDLSGDVEMDTILSKRISNLGNMSIGDAKIVIEVFAENFPQASTESIMNTLTLIEEQDSLLDTSIDKYNQAVLDYNEYIRQIQTDNSEIRYPVIQFELYDGLI